MTETHRYSVSVAAAVVRDDGKVLAIQRRDNGHWEPPGGVIDPGETIKQALIREVEEETGYRVEPGPLTGVYQNMQRDIVALVFRCTLVTGHGHATAESKAFDWLTRDEVGQLMTEAYAIRLQDAMDDRAPTSRAHDGNSLLG